MTDTIKIVQFQEKHKDQVVELVKRETAASVGVKKMNWIILFFRSNGIVQSLIYLIGLVYAVNFLFGLFVAEINIFTTIIVLFTFIFFIVLPQLTKKLAKQATHYSESIAENDLDDIKATYLSTTDKNFWVALDEYDNVCGCVGISNTMPMETQYHLGKYIKDTDGIKIAEIKRMTVNPNYRRRGIGSKLCTEAVNFAKQHNFRAIALTTVTLNQPLIGLYQKSGFFRISSFFFQVLWKMFGIQAEVYLKLL